MAEPSKDSADILLFAGEASGDAYGALLIEKLRSHNSRLRFYGGGGTKMVAAGLHPLYSSDRLSVMGLFEVITVIPTLLKIKKRVLNWTRSNKPRLAIFIDYPGFHVPLAAKIKKLGIPVLYYISPKVWAYREKRITKVIAASDHLAAIFNFEPEIYRRYGFDNCHFVGHPIVDILQSAGALDAPSDKKLVGILPGSRSSEIKRLLPTMIAACRQLREQQPQLNFWLSCVPAFDDDYYRALIGDFEIELHRDNLHTNIASSAAIAAASGTVNLEMAYLGVPAVITYRLAPLTHAIADRIIKIPHASPVNIIMSEESYPELLQNDCTPEAICRLLGELLSDDAKRRAQLADLARFREKLGQPGASERVAQLAATIGGL